MEHNLKNSIYLTNKPAHPEEKDEPFNKTEEIMN